MTDTIECRILDAAKDLILRYGYDKTTMNDIAQTAGVSKSTIYLRWQKRDDLFQSLLWRESKRYIDQWVDILERDPDTSTFGGLFRTALQALHENPFMMALYSNERELINRLIIGMDVTALYSQRMTLIAHLYEQFIAAGIVRADLDPKTVAFLTNSIQFGLLKMMEILPEEQSVTPDAALDYIVDLIDRFVTPHDPPQDAEAGRRIMLQYAELMRTEITRLDEQGGATNQ